MPSTRYAGDALTGGRVFLSHTAPRLVVFKTWQWGAAAGAFFLAVAVNVGAVWALGSSLGYVLYGNFLFGPTLGTKFIIPATYHETLGWMISPAMVALALVVASRRRSSAGRAPCRRRRVAHNPRVA